MKHPRKTCRQCQVEFTASVRHFYRAKENADGLMNCCKTCKTANVREREELKAERVRAVKAAYARRPEVREKLAAYRRSEHGKRVCQAARDRYLRWRQLEAA